MDRADTAIDALNGLKHLNPLVRAPLRRQDGTTGPLAGVPVVVKANIAVDGLPQCGASPALADNIATRSATTVQRLLAAGAVIVGQANMHELAFGITSHNPHHGPVGNPADPGRMAGGSSGGTAAAVAGGAVPMGLASDTGGSGRLPAAMCGCVGFRPTHGRYPGDGVLTLSQSFDTVTPMARDVAGIRALDAVLAGVRAGTENHAGPIRLGIVADALWEGVDAAMAEACHARVEALARQGAEIVPLSAPDLIPAIEEIAMGIVLFETRQFWEPFLAARDMTLAEFTRRIASHDVAAVFRMVAEGAAPGEADHARMAGPGRAAVARTLARLTADVDGLVMPTLALPAPLIGETDSCRINGVEQDLFTAITRRALVASVSGNPAISLPAGQLGGLPIGLEVIGRKGGDAALLALAERLEGMLAEG